MLKETAKKTAYQLEKEEKDRQIFNAWNEEMAKPGAMITAVDKFIMEQFGIYGPSTIWAIRKRVEKRMKNSQQETKQTA